MKNEREHIPLSGDGPDLPVVDLLTGRGFITGKSGSGKSNTASVIVEELLDRNLACLIVDTDGEYYGLKEEYELLHVGADEECDLQVGQEHAGKIAELAIQKNVPIILDVSGYLDVEDGNALIREVTRHLFNLEKKEKRPFLLLVEEIHEYIPETAGLDDTGRMLIRVAKRGRKRGLGLCGISQRPADVKKDFITQADWLVWHRLTWKNDTKVVRRVVGSDASEVVQNLEDGEAILIADYLDTTPLQVQVRRKHTFDAGATPDLETFERPDLKSVSSDIVDELEQISREEEERQNRIAQLERKLDKRDARIAELEDELDRAEDLSDLAEQLTQALTKASDAPDAVHATVKEIREEKNEEIRRLQKERDELEERLEKASRRIEKLEEKMEANKHLQHLNQHWEDAREAVVRLAEALRVPVEDNQERRRHTSDQRLNSETEDYSTENSTSSVSGPKELLEDEIVRTEIREAMENAPSSRYVKGVIATLLQSEDPVTYDEIAESLGIETTSHVSVAVNALAERSIVRKARKGRRTVVELDDEGLRNLKSKARRQKRTERLMDDIY